MATVLQLAVWFSLSMVAGFLFLLMCGLCISAVLGPLAAPALVPKLPEDQDRAWAESRYETPSGARPGVSKVVVVERVPCAPRSAAGTSRAARALRRETEAAKQVIRHDERPPEGKVWVDVTG